MLFVQIAGFIPPPGILTPMSIIMTYYTPYTPLHTSSGISSTFRQLPEPILYCHPCRSLVNYHVPLLSPVN
jgi:hypothetical protein